MKLHSLKPAAGSIKKGKRIGRGQGSGRGGTSTRGHKGAKSRSGYSKKLGFEGGQMPLQRRVPKFGFKNINNITYRVFNLDDLQRLSEEKEVSSFDVLYLVQNRLANRKDHIKILGRGELKASLKITAHAFSKSAKEAIEKVGGECSTKTFLETKMELDKLNKKA